MAYGLAGRLYSLSPKSFKISPRDLLRGFYRYIFDGNGNTKALVTLPLTNAIDLSAAKVDSSYLESKMWEFACAKIDKKQTVLSSADIETISPSIDHAIRKAIQDGEVSKIKMYADWGGHFAMLEGIHPAGEDYSVRVFQIV